VLYAYNARMHAGTSRSTAAAGSAAGSEIDDANGEPARANSSGTASERWFTSGFVLTLAVCTACCVVLSATDVAIVAVLRGHGEISWAGIVVIIWCAASMLGGFIHGAMPRPLPMTVLLLALGALSIPVGIAGTWWLLCLLVIPAGLACAPTIASTVDAVSRVVPPSHRGQAIGLHSAALTTGGAIGAPLVGVVIDQGGPGWGMAAIGLLVCVVAIAGIAVQFTQNRSTMTTRMFQEYADMAGEQPEVGVTGSGVAAAPAPELEGV
jgi:predicted MFS family arabinose efflux permease